MKKETSITTKLEVDKFYNENKTKHFYNFVYVDTLKAINKKSIRLIILLFFLTLNSLCNGQISRDTLEIVAYSSYNNTILPNTVFVYNQSSKYDSIINNSLELLGLPNTDIAIKTTNDFGAFSVINRKNQNRTFLYSPAFFDSIYSVTNTNMAIMSVCFHELAHQFYRHPLKPTSASHIYEKQADRYSGYQLCIIGATLDQALQAIQHFGNDLENETHPSRESRITEITRGYIDAKIKIFKDSTFYEMDRNLKSNELKLAIQNDKSASEVRNINKSVNKSASYEKTASKKSKTKQIYTLYNELIYFTSDNKIKLLSNNEIIGKIIIINRNLTIKCLDLEGVTFQLENKSIFSINPDGSKLEVGIKINK
ncbi:hypothetical protein QQY79_15145 [Flavobacterium tructae]|uniref:hypothetical protein n=1 Tax=Flavobacterium tructae TaxID=1114873 RepID=UPI002551F2DF|nr:hypothetical protein [Flavobacterium tructae]MDL2143862.1 hypothetical protein [Flavobacterium tructae]